MNSCYSDPGPESCPASIAQRAVCIFFAGARAGGDGAGAAGSVQALAAALGWRLGLLRSERFLSPRAAIWLESGP